MDAVKGKVALVTGAGRGIGRAIALCLAREGAKVVVNDVGVEVDGSGGSTQVADQVVSEIQALGGEALANYDSVTSLQNGEKMVQAAVDHFGRLDIVVTCAGILRDRMIFNMTEEEWDAVIQVHLKGTFAVVKPACVLFRQQRGGRIITISSQSGLVGNPGQANYGAAKAGIGGFTKAVARDMGRYGVTVNCVVPRAYTRMTAHLPGLGITEEYAPEDIAPFVVFLASDQAADINGQFFLVYGSTIALLAQPRPLQTIYKEGRWTLEELSDILPQTLCPRPEGGDPKWEKD